MYAIAQDDPPVTVTDAMAPGDRWLTQSVDNPAMRRFRAGRAGVAAVAVVAVAGIAIALTAAQAQGRNDEQATFQVRAEIASRFVATYVAELLLNEQVTATVQLGGIPPSSTEWEAYRRIIKVSPNALCPPIEAVPHPASARAMPAHTANRASTC